MKNRQKFILLTLFILLSMVSPSFAYEYETIDDTYFSYNIENGDEYVFDINSDISFGYKKDESYTLYDNWYNEKYNRNRDSQEYVRLLNEWLGTSMKFKFSNISIQSVNLTHYHNLPDQFYGNQTHDMFRGSITTDVNDGKGFVYPTKVEEAFYARMLAIWNATGRYSPENLQSMNETYYEFLLGDTYSYSNASFYTVISEPEYFWNVNNSALDYEQMYADRYENDGFPELKYVPIVDGMEYVSFIPIRAYPFVYFSTVPIFLPNTANLNHLSTDFENIFLFLEEIVALDSEEYYAPDTYEDFKEIYGISTLTSTDHSLGVEINLNSLNLAEIGKIPDLPDAPDNLLAEEMAKSEGIKSFSGTVSMAFEYDDNFALASFVAYIDLKASIDESLIEDYSNAGIIDDVFMKGSFSLTQEGIFPPTEKQIQNGQIGEERLNNLVPPLIPGYNLVIIGIISIISVQFIINKKMNHL